MPQTDSKRAKLDKTRPSIIQFPAPKAQKRRWEWGRVRRRMQYGSGRAKTRNDYFSPLQFPPTSTPNWSQLPLPVTLTSFNTPSPIKCSYPDPTNRPPIFSSTATITPTPKLRVFHSTLISCLFFLFLSVVVGLAVRSADFVGPGVYPQSLATLVWQGYPAPNRDEDEPAGCWPASVANRNPQNEEILARVYQRELLRKKLKNELWIHLQQ